MSSNDSQDNNSSANSKNVIDKRLKDSKLQIQ